MRHTYIIALLLIICSTASAQVYQRMPQYGYQMPRAQIDSVLRIPSDTVRNKTGVVRIGTQLYAGNGTYWSAATIDTTDIRYRPTAGDGISITGTYPSQTIAGNPDTLIAGANITLSPSGTKKVTIAANTASLDSLYGGKVDSVVQRGDTLRYFIGSDSTLVGVISGGGGGTLQDIMTGSNRDNPGGYIALGTGSAENALIYPIIAIGQNAAGDVFAGQIAIGDSAAWGNGGSHNISIGESAGSGAIPGNSKADSSIYIGNYANSNSPSQLVNAVAIGNRAYVQQSNSIVLGSIAGVNGATASASVGIGTTTPSTALHVVGGIICDSTRIGNDWFYTKKVTLSSTDILNGATNGPFLAIDAPGAGKAIQIISASQYYFFNTTAYSNGADFALKHGISFPQLMNFPVLTNNGISFGAIGILNLTSETFMENEPIYIVASSDDVDGDGTTSFYIYYRIINL